MATVKSFTDLQQSKKLAKILPIESADMYYEEVCNLPKAIVGNYILHNQCMEDKDYKKHSNPVLSPAWSLAALLEFLESEIDGEEGETYQLNIEKDGTWWSVWYKEQYDEANPIETESTEELIDACVAMVEKLNELNLL